MRRALFRNRYDFFFSSRRRHTRFDCDWSSDVCFFRSVSTTSFHAAKTMTTIEGGMLFTDDEQIARRLRIMRSQGEDPQQKYYHVELGHNFRMTELQAAIGLAQLRKLDDLLADRRTLATRYAAEFAPLGLETPPGLH